MNFTRKGSASSTLSFSPLSLSSAPVFLPPLPPYGEDGFHLLYRDGDEQPALRRGRGQKAAAYAERKWREREREKERRRRGDVRSLEARERLRTEESDGPHKESETESYSTAYVASRSTKKHLHGLRSHRL